MTRARLLKCAFGSQVEALQDATGVPHVEGSGFPFLTFAGVLARLQRQIEIPEVVHEVA